MLQKECVAKCCHTKMYINKGVHNRSFSPRIKFIAFPFLKNHLHRSFIFPLNPLHLNLSFLLFSLIDYPLFSWSCGLFTSSLWLVICRSTSLNVSPLIFMLVFPPLFLWLFLVFLYPLSSYLDQPSSFSCYPHHLPPIPFFIYALPSLHHVILPNHMCVFFFLFNLFTRLSFGQLCVLFGFFFWVLLSYLSSLGLRLAFMMGKPHGKYILQELENQITCKH